MIKLGKASLRGEIIRPVCKCKLLRNFLPSPPFRARYFWQIFRECECGEVSANVKEDREIFIHVCENLKLHVTRVTRGRRDQIRKREEVIGQMVQHGPTFDSEIQERKAGKTRTTIENGRYHKCHYPSNPSATESMRNKECRTMNLDQNPAWQKIILVCLRFHTQYIFFIYGFVLYILYPIARNIFAVSPCSFHTYHLTVFR